MREYLTETLHQILDFITLRPALFYKLLFRSVWFFIYLCFSSHLQAPPPPPTPLIFYTLSARNWSRDRQRYIVQFYKMTEREHKGEKRLEKRTRKAHRSVKNTITQYFRYEPLSRTTHIFLKNFRLFFSVSPIVVVFILNVSVYFFLALLLHYQCYCNYLDTKQSLQAARLK